MRPRTLQAVCVTALAVAVVAGAAQLVHLGYAQLVAVIAFGFFICVMASGPRA